MQIKAILSTALIITLVIFAGICIISSLPVYAASTPVASFSVTPPTSGTAPLSVSFSDTSSNSPTSYSWTFGDGGTSTVNNPTHIYTKAGTYSVTHTATNSNGTSSPVIQTNIITVYPGTASSLTIYPTTTLISVAGTPTLPDDGGEAAGVVAVLTDAYGNPISNVTVQFTTSTGSVYYSQTDSTGTTGLSTSALPICLGPSYSQTTQTIWATYSSLTSNIFAVRFADCLISVSTNASIATVGTQVMANATVTIDGVGYNNIPVTFRLKYNPLLNPVDTSIVNTTSGFAQKVETVSNDMDVNYILASVDPLGVSTYTTVITINASPTKLTVTSTAMGKVDSNGNAFADGNSRYDIIATLLDAYNNPIEGVPINFTDSNNNQLSKVTSSSGIAEISSATSNYIQTIVLNITTVNNLNKTLNLNFVAGPATRIFVKSNPNVIASSDVIDPLAPHSTAISALVTDDWYHPVINKQVNFSTLSGPGLITGNATGYTDNTGSLNTVFTLNHTTTHDSMITPASPNYPYYAMAQVQAQMIASSNPVNAVASITYTNNSFLSVKSNITPTNATLHNPINVFVNITGIGWQVNSTPSDVFLLVDTSGSMAWYADVDTSSNVAFNKTGTMTDGTDYTNNNSWHYVGDYILNTTSVHSFDIMATWNFNNLNQQYTGTDTHNTYYLMKIVTPDGKTIIEPSGTNTPGFTTHKTISPGYGKTETIWTVDDVTNWNGLNLASGHYKIYLFYHIGSIAGPSPYYLTAETTDQREPSAKNAVTAFVNNVANYSSVGLITFGAPITNPSTPIQAITSMNKSSDRNNLLTTISGITHNGQGTNTYEAIGYAINHYPNDGVQHVMVLVTDGFSYNPAWDISNATLANASHIKIYTVGIGGANMSLLEQISNITGLTNGSYYANNQTDLVDKFGNLALSLQDTIAQSSTLSLISDRTLVNGTYYNNTEYITNSALVTCTANTTPHNIEPIINLTSDGYQLMWYPGAININDFWNLKYQLMVNYTGANGFIQPITNHSSISFVRPNSTSPIMMYLDGNTVFVSNNSSGFGGKTINITITSPTPNEVIYDNTIPIGWNVSYNGTGNYTVTLSFSNSNGETDTINVYPETNATTLQGVYHWPIKDYRDLLGNGLPYGPITIYAAAVKTDGSDSASASVVFVWANNNGQIILK